MTPLSYNISTQLRQNLIAIERLRHSILLTPITTANKRTMRFEALTKRIYFGLGLEKNLSLSDLAYFLMLQHTHTPQKIKERDYINRYKKALDYVSQDWLVNTTPVGFATVHQIGKILEIGRMRAEKESLSPIIEYLESQHESPIIQSALTLTQIPKIQVYSEKTEDAARVLALLYLYKGAYDFRGFVVIEEELQKNKGEFQVMYTDALRTENQTLWLEYYTGCFLRHLEHIQARMTTFLTQAGWKSDVPGEDLPPTVDDTTIERMTKLTRRQRSILTLIETPSATISNKYVQDMFHVSQITASRDLSRLTALGLLVVHASGRSTNYTKA